MPAHTHCRICTQSLPGPFLDLGEMPLANSFLSDPEEFAAEQARIFEADKRQAKRVTYEEWKKRGFWKKILEKLLAPFRSQL